MEDFLLKNYILITHAIEVIVALTGVLLYSKYRGTPVTYFIWFLIYLTICDILGGYARYVHPDKFLSFLIGTVIEKNYWWATSYWIIGAILFYSFYFYRILKKYSFKNTIKFGAITFFIFSVSYIILNINDFSERYFPILGVLGSIIIFLCSVFYLIEVLQSDKVLTFYKSLNFYISVVIFIWWLVVTPLEFYDVYFTYEVGSSKRDWNFIFLRWQIYLFANIFMYSTFTFALIFCEPELNND